MGLFQKGQHLDKKSFSERRLYLKCDVGYVNHSKIQGFEFFQKNSAIFS